jgi:breast cancer 2 susceptibility protein
LAPENIDELYDTLDDPIDANATMAKLGPLESGWLARHIQITIEKENEAAGEQIEQELQVFSDAIYASVTKNPCQKSFPSRDVRNFRVVVAQDACTRRRPANRIAQITVWDVLGLSFEEGSSQGTLKTGQRFLVSRWEGAHTLKLTMGFIAGD